MIECLTCKQLVNVKFIPYGNGHIADCPLCKKLAYNGVPQTPEEASNKCIEHMTKLNEENLNEL